MDRYFCCGRTVLLIVSERESARERGVGERGACGEVARGFYDMNNFYGFLGERGKIRGGKGRGKNRIVVPKIQKHLTKYLCNNPKKA